MKICEIIETQLVPPTALKAAVEAGELDAQIEVVSGVMKSFFAK